MRTRIAVRRSGTIAAAAVAVLSLALWACGGDDAPPAAAAAPDTQPAPTRAPPTASSGAEFFPASALASVAGELAKGTTTARTVGAHPSYSYVQARRTSSGVPEVHDRWIDVVMVQAGHARLLTGGHVDGSGLASPGEHRGGTIVGGTGRSVDPGDLVVIPAGVPHQYQLATGDSIRYLTIKVLHTGEPADGGRARP
jgi:hypothetical protein